MRYSEVFVPGGFPRHTYNPRRTRKLEERLGEVADNLSNWLQLPAIRNPAKRSS